MPPASNRVEEKRGGQMLNKLGLTTLGVGTLLTVLVPAASWARDNGGHSSGGRSFAGRSYSGGNRGYSGQSSSGQSYRGQSYSRGGYSGSGRWYARREGYGNADR